MQTTTKDMIAANRTQPSNFKAGLLTVAAQLLFSGMKVEGQEVIERQRADRPLNGVDYKRKKRLRKISDAARKANRKR